MYKIDGISILVFFLNLLLEWSTFGDKIVQLVKLLFFIIYETKLIS